MNNTALLIRCNNEERLAGNSGLRFVQECYGQEYCNRTIIKKAAGLKLKSTYEKNP